MGDHRTRDELETAHDRSRLLPTRSQFNFVVTLFLAFYLLVVAMIPMIQGTEVLITPGLIAALAVGAVGSTWPLWRAMVEYAVHRAGVWFPLAVAMVVVVVGSSSPGSGIGRS